MCDKAGRRPARRGVFARFSIAVGAGFAADSGSSHDTRRARPAAAPWVALVGLAVAACATTDAIDAAVAPKLTLEIEHEACDLEGGDQVDVNGDGRADIVKVRSGDREICRAVDLNFDGIKDGFIYFDTEGRERRRESDFDRDGQPDEVSTSEGGVVRRKERETNYDGKLDTWETYVDGRLAKTERDSDGDGVLDEWWDHPRPDAPQCAIVVRDKNSDGRPDPDTSVDLCADGSATPPPPTPTASAPSAPPAPASSAASSAAPAASSTPPAPASPSAGTPAAASSAAPAAASSAAPATSAAPAAASPPAPTNEKGTP
jgi:hypothetical protein